MADFSISITVPDDKISDLLDAIRREDGDGSLTAAECKAVLKAHGEQWLRKVYRKHKQAIQDAAGQNDIDIT